MSRPKFTAVAVITLDGKIAKTSDHNVDWASPEDKKFLNQKIKEHDAIIVGRNTFEVAKKILSKEEFATRHYIVLTRSVKSLKRESEQVLWVNPQAVDLRQLMADNGHESICILGGSQIYSLMMEQGLTDEIFLTIEPLIFGTGINFIDNINLQNKFNLLSVEKLNKTGTVLLHYKKS